MTLWPKYIEDTIEKMLDPMSLHVCCGESQLGDVRLDLHQKDVDITCDASDMKSVVADELFKTVLCDPPHDMSEKWYDALLIELARVSSHRIIFQHWFIPSHMNGVFQADSQFKMSYLLTWHPQSTYDQALAVSVFDK